MKSFITLYTRVNKNNVNYLVDYCSFIHKANSYNEYSKPT